VIPCECNERVELRVELVNVDSHCLISLVG